MATLTIDVNDLPARYAEAVSRAEQGDEVVITATGQRPVRLIPVPAPVTRPRVLGMHPGSMVMAPDFDAPLPDEFWLGEP
jgi:antitoxin (DNA-binding transcriptional repressor) of toxin-antitoxin stability system